MHKLTFIKCFFFQILASDSDVLQFSVSCSLISYIFGFRTGIFRYVQLANNSIRINLTWKNSVYPKITIFFSIVIAKESIFNLIIRPFWLSTFFILQGNIHFQPVGHCIPRNFSLMKLDANSFRPKNNKLRYFSHKILKRI